MQNDVEKRPGTDTEPRKKHGLRPLHMLGVVALGVLGVVVAFWVLSSIAGILFGFVKVVVILAVLGGVVWALMRRGRRR